MPKLRQTSHTLDIPLLIGVILLLVFGVIMVYDASVVYAHDFFGGKYHFLFLQTAWVVIGSLGLFLILNLDYHHLPSFALPLFLLSLALLLLCLIPSPFTAKVLGARRWIILNPKPLPSLPLLERVNFQPAEFAKLSWIVYLSSWLSESKKRAKKLKGRPGWLSFVFLLGILGGLVILQPDFGTAMVLLGIGIITYFVSGANLLYFFIGIPFLFLGGLFAILFSSYRKERLLTFLNPKASDPLAAGYHIQQILIAVGSGGLFGLGLGQSRQKYAYLPEVTADSIFAVVAEETGFFGSAVLIIAFLFVIFRGFKIAKEAKDDLGKLLATGVTSWFALQVFINLAAMTALIPLTGIPLPLISYGGSSMIFMLLGIGILLNVSRGKR